MKKLNIKFVDENSKAIARKHLIDMIKFKHKNIEGLEYDSQLKTYHLIKGDNGLFNIEIPST
jgi:hypothetical protein